MLRLCTLRVCMCVLLGCCVGALSVSLLDSGRDADYRLCTFPRVQNMNGGCISGKKFFFLVDLFCSGHYNPVDYFRFRITIVVETHVISGKI